MDEFELTPPIGSVEVEKIQEQIRESRTSLEQELDSRVDLYAQMAYLPGWDLFKKEVEQKIESYRGLKNIDPSKMSLANIGLRFMVGQTISEELQQLISRVDKCRAEVEARENVVPEKVERKPKKK